MTDREGVDCLLWFFSLRHFLFLLAVTAGIAAVVVAAETSSCQMRSRGLAWLVDRLALLLLVVALPAALAVLTTFAFAWAFAR